MTKNYYRILEVEPSASESEIKKAYFRLALRWHPDKNLHRKEESETKFKEIVRAYKILSSPDEKRRYDIYRETGYYGEFEEIAEEFEKYLERMRAEIQAEKDQLAEEWRLWCKLEEEFEEIDKDAEKTLLEEKARIEERMEREWREKRRREEEKERQHHKRLRKLKTLPKVSLFWEWEEEEKSWWSSTKKQKVVIVGPYNQTIKLTDSSYQKTKNDILEIILVKKEEWRFEELLTKRKRDWKLGWQYNYEKPEKFIVHSSFNLDNYDKNGDLIIDYGKIHWEGGFDKKEELPKIEQAILGKTQWKARQEIRLRNERYPPR